MRNTDPAHGPSGANDPNRGAYGLLGADAFNDEWAELDPWQTILRLPPSIIPQLI
jgi:hypothetical protein